jgi:hypothetical protein
MGQLPPENSNALSVLVERARKFNAEKIVLLMK